MMASISEASSGIRTTTPHCCQFKFIQKLAITQLIIEINFHLKSCCFTEQQEGCKYKFIAQNKHQIVWLKAHTLFTAIVTQSLKSEFVYTIIVEGGGQKGAGDVRPPQFRINKNKCLFYKFTIKVYVMCI